MMDVRIIAAAGALLIPAGSMAQAGPEAKVTPDQLVCKLSGDCAESDPSLNTQDKVESRGFSIARRTSTASNNQAVTPAQPSASRVPHANVATVSHGQSSAPMSRFAILHHPAPAVGHADLSINFISGSAVLSESGRDLAQTFMQALRSPQLAGKRFMIGGHTDAVGSRALNLSLAKQRAQALVDFLVGQGASRSHFDVKGFGFDRPLPGTNRTAPANRRVEVVTLN